MPALTLRPAPLDRVAARRALPAVVIAVAGGAWLALAVAVVFGADLGSGEAVWIAVAGSCGCLSGLMIGAGGNVAGAAMLAAAAIAAAALAGAAGDSNPTHVAADIAPAPRAQTRADEAAPARTGDAVPARGDRAREVTPTARPADPVARAGRLVRSYYAAIDAGDFTAAWDRLSPAVQASLGGFDVWRQGYATTLKQRVEAVEVDGDVIQHVLVARDRTPCGTTVEQRFAVEWTVVRSRATALHAVRLAGQDPAAAC